MKREWGTVSPERRYRLSSITELFTKSQQEGGIINMKQYRKFIGEYEAIITYLKRYQYIPGDIKLPQNSQPYRPRNPLPPFASSYKPYIPAQMSPRPPIKCAYCKEEGYSDTKCTHLAEDLDRRIVRTQGASYLFPNYQRVPMEGNESVKNIVRAFSKEQSELKKKFMAKQVVKPKPEEEVKPTEKKSEDKSTSISHVEDWSNWKPPTISSANDAFESHIGLRQTKQRM
ncbi:hypothetical protein O181_028552 [Austropuccinia psidii MF-1]|uniref:Uncharacterized protein n=1 Tax=Austropuccinia psidii MF-1 TaxID=1389203 RepID=A0A9Q3CUT7_9BASI|nr:hypothetical protein [Austropuccinia psidii MF-1]